MSEEKKQRVYDSIANETMDLRIELQKDKRKKYIELKDVDNELFKLNLRIWNKVKYALDIS